MMAPQKDLLPSDFADTRPMESVLRCYEGEAVARNIMTILRRNGNAWRKLPWAEYRRERIADGNFSEYDERPWFDKTLRYTISPLAAVAFSPAWAKAAGV